MRVTAEREAEEILKNAADKAAQIEQESVRSVAKAREERGRAEREVAAMKAAAREQSSKIQREAEDKAGLIVAEAKERAAKLERTATVNVEAIVAEGRAQYERLRRASQFCADRLAALEVMIRDVRNEIPLDGVDDHTPGRRPDLGGADGGAGEGGDLLESSPRRTALVQPVRTPAQAAPARSRSGSGDARPNRSRPGQKTGSGS